MIVVILLDQFCRNVLGLYTLPDERFVMGRIKAVF